MIAALLRYTYCVYEKFTNTWGIFALFCLFLINFVIKYRLSDFHLTTTRKDRGANVIKKEMIAMLLAGGQGSRLGILTSKVAKPAVSFGGKYRIIDFPLSN